MIDNRISENHAVERVKRLAYLTDPLTHRRVKVCAAKRGISITEFLAGAVDAALLEPAAE